MKTSTLDTWIWVLIYGGLLVAGLGLSVIRVNGALAAVVTVGGVVIAAVGVALIYVRSRMKGQP